ncbi:hypothetical protein L1987_53671 [Smallanthus sonchifolius]|uniref:Uncharacterized protein n=1 Tax=Smallanthus sonchifolius TaxID=185202 RepID=A0ACB9EXB1_9ASTR|nr:hypothetical protein L1987_53671 [Smallanthus sonchifolius]
MDTQLETLPDNRDDGVHQSPNDGINATNDFEKLARSWLSTLPAEKSLNPSDVETWLQSINSSLPDNIKSMPPSDVYQILTSFSTNEEKDPFYFRFQRSDQWMPIYSWLETLKTDEVIKSKEIVDWLTENADIRDDLLSRHSRYHLMHYIKKCHMKILKKREKKKGLHTTIKISSSRAHKTEEKKSLLMLPSSSSVTKLPKDSPIYTVKRNEAFRKYQILTEMEKQLGTIFQNQETANVVAGP